MRLAARSTSRLRYSSRAISMGSSISTEVTGSPSAALWWCASGCRAAARPRCRALDAVDQLHATGLAATTGMYLRLYYPALAAKPSGGHAASSGPRATCPGGTGMPCCWKVPWLDIRADSSLLAGSPSASDSSAPPSRYAGPVDSVTTPARAESRRRFSAPIALIPLRRRARHTPSRTQRLSRPPRLAVTQALTWLFLYRLVLRHC